MKTVTSMLVAGILLTVCGAAFADDADDAAEGQKIYQTSCHVCHATGVAGAPKLGDKEAWAPRIATGMDALLTSAINGKNAMPPKGTCMSCSDADLKAAIEYMVSQSQ
jgi:cytochrome c5